MCLGQSQEQVWTSSEQYGKCWAILRPQDNLSFFSFHKGFLSADYKVSFSGGSDGKESTCDAGDLGSIPGLARSPGKYDKVPVTALEYCSNQHKQQLQHETLGLLLFLNKRDR